MKILIGGGTGLIGRSLVNHFLQQGHQLTIVGRSVDKIDRTFGHTVSAANWQALKKKSIYLDSFDAIINLAGASIGEKRWSTERKKSIIDSRIQTTTLLSELCAELGENSPPLLNASAVGIYGLQKAVATGLPTAMDESTVPTCDTPPDFLTKVACQWEQATTAAKEKGVRVVNCRFGVVLANEGGALPKLVLPFYFFIGGRIGNGQQPFAWVSIADVISALDYLLEHPEISGPVNIVAPDCVTQQQLATAIGETIKRPSVMLTPAFMLKLAFGQMAEELLLHGQNVAPTTLQEHGFQFEYPDIHSALEYALVPHR